MENTVKIKRTKAYKIILSTGEPVRIEQEELQKLLDNVGTKGMIVFKTGIVNPSFIVSVVEDGERMEAYVRECKATAEIREGYTQGDRATSRGLQPLKSIFEGKLDHDLKIGSIKAAQELGMDNVDIKLLN